jgi:hypothetical protein
MPPGEGDIVAIPEVGGSILGTNGAPPERSSRHRLHAQMRTSDAP